MFSNTKSLTQSHIQVLVKEAGIRPMGVSVAHPVQTEAKLSAPCTDHSCSHVCLPMAMPSEEYTCTCPSHMLLSPDNDLQCVEDPRASKVSFTHELGVITPISPPSRYS